MAIAETTERWLKGAGYEYHCFISWPSTVNSYMGQFAGALKESLTEELAFQITEPRVYLAPRDIAPGTQWESDLKEALCGSICMVALCIPVYFHEKHRWCLLEWASMEELTQRRLGSDKRGAIIPIVLSEMPDRPPALAALQHIDLSSQKLRGRSFLRSQDFRSVAVKVVARIDEIATRIVSRKAKAGCDKFDFPDESRLPKYDGTRKELPFAQ